MRKIDKLNKLLKKEEAKIDKRSNQVDFEKIGGGLHLNIRAIRPQIFVDHYSGGRIASFKHSNKDQHSEYNKQVDRILEALKPIADKYEKEIIKVLNKLGYK